MTRREWVKLSGDFWRSPSHWELSLEAFAIGPLLIELANRDKRPGRWGTVQPTARVSVARQVSELLRSRITPAQVELAIDEFVAAGTIVREGAAIRFPRFAEWQSVPKGVREAAAGAGDLQAELPLPPSPQFTQSTGENDSLRATDQTREDQIRESAPHSAQPEPEPEQKRRPATASRRRLEPSERAGGTSTLAARPVAEVLAPRPDVAPERTEDVRAAIRAQLGLRDRAPP